MLVLQLQTALRQPSDTLFTTLNIEIVYLFKTQVPKNNTLRTYPGRIPSPHCGSLPTRQPERWAKTPAFS